jgi:hypothetical protein
LRPFGVVRRVVFALLIEAQGLLRDLLNRAELRPELRPDFVCPPQDLRAERLKRQGMGTPLEGGTTRSYYPSDCNACTALSERVVRASRSAAIGLATTAERPTGPGTSRGPLQPAFTKAVARTVRPSHHQDHSLLSDLDGERCAAAHPMLFQPLSKGGTGGTARPHARSPHAGWS